MLCVYSQKQCVMTATFVVKRLLLTIFRHLVKPKTSDITFDIILYDVIFLFYMLSTDFLYENAFD